MAPRPPGCWPETQYTLRRISSLPTANSISLEKKCPPFSNACPLCLHQGLSTRVAFQGRNPHICRPSDSKIWCGKTQQKQVVCVHGCKTNVFSGSVAIPGSGTISTNMSGCRVHPRFPFAGSCHDICKMILKKVKKQLKCALTNGRGLYKSARFACRRDRPYQPSRLSNQNVCAPRNATTPHPLEQRVTT